MTPVAPMPKMSGPRMAASCTDAGAFRRPRPAVRRLMLEDFRNYAELDLALPESGFVLLTGPNGAGKTNLLEAVSLLSPGRGLRRARLADMRHQARAGYSWSLSAHLCLEGDESQTVFGAACQFSESEGEKRLYRLNGAPQTSAAAFAERWSILWLTPAMDRLFVEGPSGRRRFLDRLILTIDPAHAGRTLAYEKALRERGRLLRGDNESRSADRTWLASLETIIAEKGVAIAAARLQAADALQEGLDAAPLGPFPRARLCLLGLLEGWLADMPAVQAEDRFRAALEAARGEGEEGAPGPHRSDFTLVHVSKRQDAALCSTGEQKALLISLLLAQARLGAARRGAPPLLLLDEIAAHLDESRRRALFEQLAELGGQAWMTGTDAAPFNDLPAAAAHYAVAEAHVTAY